MKSISHIILRSGIFLGVILFVFLAFPVFAHASANVTFNIVCSPTNDIGEFYLRQNGTIIIPPATKLACGSQVTVEITSAGSSPSSHWFGEFLYGWADGWPAYVNQGSWVASMDAVYSGDCVDEGLQSVGSSGQRAHMGSVTVVNGDNKTCTITNSPSASTGRFNLNIVDNTDTSVTGGFGAQINGVSNYNTSNQNNYTKVYFLQGGSYRVEAANSSPSTTTVTISGDCTANGDFTIATGQTKNCTVTRNMNSGAWVGIFKTVTNHGGTKQVSDFPLFVDGNPIFSGASNFYASGIHHFTETQDPNYVLTYHNFANCNWLGGGYFSVPNGGPDIVCGVVNEEIVPASHTECTMGPSGQSFCGTVNTAGTNQCSTNVDCGTSSHNACSAGVCIIVSGAGANECSSSNDCVAASHTVCSSGPNGLSGCVSMTGPGTNQCLSNNDCSTSSVGCNAFNQCVIGGTNGSCATDNDCNGSGATRCNTSNQCVVGGTGNLCASNADCTTSSTRCNASNQCVVGGTGVPCAINTDCTGGSSSRCNTSNQCVIGGSGLTCLTNSDCTNANTTRCSSANQCVIGGTGALCASNADCSGGTSPRCNASNQCVVGGTGVPCAVNADCTGGASSRCNASNQCVVGGSGLTCLTNSDCTNPSVTRCSPANQCIAGGTGILCSSSGDCSGTRCNASNQCVVGGSGISCSNVRDCTNASPQSLILNKVVDNTGGGTAQESSWILEAFGNAPNYFSGPGAPGNADVVSPSNLPAEGYNLRESGGVTGYNRSIWMCLRDGTANGVYTESNIIVAPGDHWTCTITNYWQGNNSTPKCNASNQCVAGGTGIVCSTNADCVGSNTPTCSTYNQCMIGGGGKSCVDDTDCGVPDATRCNASNQCVAGGTGAVCASNSDCTGNLTRCNAFNQCVLGGSGAACISSGDCNNIYAGCNASNQCIAGGTGALCNSSADCTNLSTKCNNFGQCVLGGSGMACSADSQCPNNYPTTTCNSSGQCVSGGGGHSCSTSADCNASYTTCNTLGQCVENGGGRSCLVAGDCTDTFTTCNVFHQCVADGGGEACSSSNSCIDDPVHSTCENSKCKMVFGQGTNECSSDAQCSANASLTVTKIVINHGGDKTVSHFPLFVDGDMVVSGAQNQFAPGAYTVSEITDSDYTSTISGDCASNGTITLTAGQTKFCFITNEERRAYITVNKTVVAHGGSATSESFEPYRVDTTPVALGIATAFDSGTHTITENSDPDYTQTFSGDCNSAGSITLAPGDNKTCTITNECVNLGSCNIEEITDNPPAADDLTVAGEDNCSLSPTSVAFFNWVYNDEDGDTENKFQFQISTNAGFTNIVVDRTFSNLSNSPGSQNQQAVYIGATENDSMTYNKTYYWRVKVWQAARDGSGAGLNSGWVSGGTYATPNHPSPSPNFTFTQGTPTNFDASFSNQSICYNSLSTPVPCQSYAWNFGDNGTSSAVNPNHTYAATGTYTVNLKTYDSSGLMCEINKDIIISTGGANGNLPWWREVSPF